MEAEIRLKPSNPGVEPGFTHRGNTHVNGPWRSIKDLVK